mgnify:CR=1 FL=1
MQNAIPLLSFENLYPTYDIVKSLISNEDTLELFIDNKKGSKELSDCPADINMKLIDGINKVTFINQNKLYSLQTT